MTARRRGIVFATLLAACAVATAVAVVSGIASSRSSGTSAAAAKLVAGAARAHRPLVVFRSLDRSGGSISGELAVAPLHGGTPGGRTLSGLRCDRVYFARTGGLCVTRGSSFAAGYRAEVIGPDLAVRHERPVDGVPSRARVSADGRYGSVTMFVTGHSYADSGQFSTATTLIDMRTGRSIANLEQFVTTRAGRRITAIDVNYWGVTFAQDDSDRFYATLATGGRTYLVEGSVRARSAHVIHENVECPSLSPDGTRIAFKKRTDSGARPWRLTVLDLRTMRETPLAETRSIDDQAEWADAGHVLYADGGSTYEVAADGSGAPRRFIAGGESPAVVRW